MADGGAVKKAWAGLGQLSNYTVSGKTPNYTAMTLNPFSFENEAVHAANVQNTWRRVARMVGKAMDFYATPLGKVALNDPAFRASASALGLSGYEADAFESLRKDLVSGYNLHLEDMAKGAMARRANRTERGELLTDRERGLIAGMVMQRVTMDATPATMPAWAMSGAGQVMMTLMGWPYRRFQQVSRMDMNKEGERSMRALLLGIGSFDGQF
jgi:hypothetical protein